MAEHQRKTLDFVCKGMNLAKPVDKLAPGEYRLLQNCRPVGQNQIWGRQGITQESSNTATDPIHTIKRMNDPMASPTRFPGAFQPAVRFVGAGTKLYFSIPSSPPSLDAFTSLGELDSGFSGDPLSIRVVTPVMTPRPYAFFADSLKMRKANTNGFAFQVGVPPPNFAPVISIEEPNASGPDIGDTGLPYSYRFVARCDPEVNTGATSAPGPPVRDEDALSPGGGDSYDPGPSSIRVGVGEAHPNPQVTRLDIYRYGGSLPEWIWIGSTGNYVGAGFTDYFADGDIADNPRLESDTRSIHYQPWVAIDTPRQGTCIVGADGHTVTLNGSAGEDLFREYNATGDDPYYVMGNQIVINGTYCTFYKCPTDDHTVEVLQDISRYAGATLDWNMDAPQMARQPFPFLWGPFGGGESGTFLFGCGNPLLPGALYWTKGNDPESHPPANVLEITEGSERLQNGCMYDGRAYVFSTERMFAIYPSFGQVSDFVAVEVPGSRGLYRRWAIDSNGPAIYSRARDGIYATAGTTTVCISQDIAPLFGTEQETALPNAWDGMGDLTTIKGPDPNEEEWESLSFADGYLYYDFKDTAGNCRTLVYDTDPESHGRGKVAPGWISLDIYTPTVTRHYQEEGSDNHTILLGTSDGRLFVFDGYSDGGVAINGKIRGPAFDAGDTRARKHWTDSWLDYDSDCDQFTWRLGFDNFTFFTDPVTATINLTGRQQAIGDINSGTGQYAANIGIDIYWSVLTGQVKFYAWEPSWLPKPEVTAHRVTDWTDDGYSGDKFFQGVILTADGLAQQRTVQIHKDGGAIADTLTVNHLSGEQQKPYSFATPFISHMVRLLPTDENFWRLIGARWIWEPMPELTEYWQTQSTNLDFDGFFHHRHAYIALLSSAVVTFEIRVDGVSYTYSIPSTAGVPGKPYIVLQPMKGKLVEYYKLSCPSGFRLFQKDCEVWAKQWGTEGPYIKKNPFGDIHRVRGAVI